MATDPHALFDAWFAEAKASEPNDAEAMTLATVGADGRPSARMVLLKGHDARGFVDQRGIDAGQRGIHCGDSRRVIASPPEDGGSTDH